LLIHILRRKFGSAIRRLVRFLRAFKFYLYNHAVTHVPGYFFRTSYLRFLLGYRIGPGVAIHMGCFVTGEHIEIGRNSVINRRCYLDGRGGLRIGESVSISPEVYLISATHAADDPKFGSVMKPVLIGDRVWIGARAMVLPGVTIEEGAVLGAGSVAGKNIPSRAICVGNPARQVRMRGGDLNYKLRYFPWFDTDIG